MKKTIMVVVILALIPYGLVWAHNEGLSGGGGGGNAGGGGGYSGGGGGGGNAGGGGGSTGSNTSNDTVYHGQHYSNGRAYYRSSGRTYNYNRGYRGNGSYQGSGTFHHFNFSTNSRYNGSNTYHSNVVPQNLQRMGVTSIPRPLSSSAMLSHNLSHSAPGLPSQGPAGRSFSSSVVSPRGMNSPAIRTQMAAIAGNRNFMAKVAATTPIAGRTNQYLWHSWNGYNYCNYYDRFGNCWWGWNCGGGFFWSQYYAGNWWWYDPWYGNWDYWYGNNWWWQNPETTNVYVYNNGQYTPAQGDGNAGGSAGNGNGSSAYNQDDYGGPVYGDNQEQKLTNNIEPNGSAANASNEPIDFVSQDGKVKVAVSATGDAFLYDLNNSKASGKPVYLDTNVQEVKFSSTGTGPTKILLIFKDGTFETFNSDGTPAGSVKT